MREVSLKEWNDLPKAIRLVGGRVEIPNEVFQFHVQASHATPAHTTGTISMSLHVTFIAFSLILRHTTLSWGTKEQSPTAGLTWLYARPHFGKQGTTVGSDYFGAYYSNMCRQRHSWLKMSEFFKLYFNSVFHHYIWSVPVYSNKSKWLFTSFDS